MARTQIADARISLRVPRELKERLEKAASLSGHSSLSDFVVTSAYQRATDIIHQEARIELEPEDFEDVRAYVNSDIQPSETIRQFIDEYKYNFVPKTGVDRTDEPF